VFDKESIGVFLDKVPGLRTPWRAFLTVVYVLLLGFLCGAFFFYLDRLALYAPLVTQLVMALVVTLISYVHFKKAGEYRDKYGSLAYRNFFYRFMIPYLVTWYACFFHPLFVDGKPLLPSWLAIGLGVLFLVLLVLTSVHIERAGFHEVTHGMDVYTVFPEEATVVRGAIYSYIRHPLYFSLMCGSIGLAFFKNNAAALAVALLLLIPSLAAARMEDDELIEREGEAHREYMRKTPALVPARRFREFLSLLVFLGK